MSRIIPLIISLLLIGTCTTVLAEEGTAHATKLMPYTRSNFEAIQKSGAVNIIQFHANWCPTCRTQKKSLEIISQDPQFQNVLFFIADYDNETELKNTLSVTRQSTVIIFKGDKEVARSTSNTGVSSLQRLLMQALH